MLFNEITLYANIVKNQYNFICEEDKIKPYLRFKYEYGLIFYFINIFLIFLLYPISPKVDLNLGVQNVRMKMFVYI